MTETQRAVIERLLTDSMTVKDMAADLHINQHALRNTMRAMARQGWLKINGEMFSLSKDYQAPLSWNFKPLLGVWK